MSHAWVAKGIPFRESPPWAGLAASANRWGRCGTAKMLLAKICAVKPRDAAGSLTTSQAFASHVGSAMQPSLGAHAAAFNPILFSTSSKRYTLKKSIEWN